MSQSVACRHFYHLTRLEHIERIKKEGIKPSNTGYVYLCDNKLDPFFMAPCGRAARTRFALSMIDKQPFLEQLALIEVHIPYTDVRAKIRKLPFTWFEGDRLIENKTSSIYQQYLYDGTIPWRDGMSYEIYTFCDPDELKRRWGISDGKSGDTAHIEDNEHNKEVREMLDRIARVLPC